MKTSKQNNSLPWWARLFLRLFVSADDIDQYSGDYEETYKSRLINNKFNAKLFLVSQLLRSIPTFFSARLYWGVIMFSKYLKISLRNMRRNLSHTIINITGLVVGIACFILIMLWVKDETSFDTFHKNYENIYRVTYDYLEDDGRGFHTPGKLSAALVEELPEVISSVRVMPQTGTTDVKYGEKGFYETNVFYSDPSFFKVFSFPIIYGEKENMLVDPNTIVISNRIAKKYFGKNNPIGKTLKLWGSYEAKITGVIENNNNSHLSIDFLVPNAKLKQWWPAAYQWNNFVDHNTYVLLRSNSNIGMVEKKITDITFANSPGSGKVINKFSLQPINSIHLDTDVPGGNTPGGDRTYVTVFTIVAFLILLIACINFMNLSTGTSMKRRKEVGLRKVIGSTRYQLIKQFLTESLFITFLSSIIALFIVYVSLPVFNQLFGKHLTLNFSDPGLYLTLFLIVLVTGFIAGSYPAFYISSFSPVSILKNQSVSRLLGLSLRKTLVVIQYTLSIALIICTILIYNQINYMQNQKMGFNSDNIIYMEAKGDLAWKYETARNELIKIPNISQVALKRKPPMQEDWFGPLRWEGQDTDMHISTETIAVDYNYLDMMDFKIVKGRGFSEEYSTDAGGAVVINETLAKLTGFDNPIGQKVKYLGSNDAEIIGVIKDAHVASLKYPVRPQAYYISTNSGQDKIHLWGIILIKLNPANLENTLASIEKVWDEFNPGYPFEYHFVSEEIDRLYQNEQKVGSLFTYFTSLAILISSLGLFGLALLTAEQRTKEIGIRKVNGASTSEVVNLLNKEFVKSVIAAWLLAVPLAYFVISKWLEGFAYKSQMPAWVFVAAGFLVLLIALFTISWQTVRAAKKNPIDALRYE